MAGRHILVVDDEPDIRAVVRDILEDEGYSVTTAENGEDAADDEFVHGMGWNRENAAVGRQRYSAGVVGLAKR